MREAGRRVGLTQNSPFGDKGFVVFNKGGNGGVYNRPTDATSSVVFPDPGASGDSAATYSYATLN